MELYLHLKRDYKPSEYLSCVKDSQIKKDTNKVQTERSLSGYRERMTQTKMAATRTESVFTVLAERGGNRGTFLTAL